MIIFLVFVVSLIPFPRPQMNLPLFRNAILHCMDQLESHCWLLFKVMVVIAY